MPAFDLPLEELRRYRPEQPEPDDFDAFWTGTLEEARAVPVGARFAPFEAPLSGVEVFDATFAGYGGHPVKGWLLLPAGGEGPLPAVVKYIGYNGGRGLPHEHLLWPAAGFACLVMDSRGQGSGGSVGDTPDPVGSAPAHPGQMTRGIGDRDGYYYRRLFTDAVRAVEAVRAHPRVDPSRVAVTGGSQGGGITLAVAGLVPGLAAVAVDVPFLCHFPRALRVAGSGPYREIAAYLRAHRDHVDAAFRTLAYFDGAHFAARATAPALFSVALEDTTCPPSTVFAAYNSYRGADKAIEVYPFNDHEGGGPFQTLRQLEWLPARCAGPATAGVAVTGAGRAH
ncbi:putative acetyl xylan esterase [Actinacidiphila reveromycinica]|uniref:Putative acetyl xylan esterase n=1 Tax=Actinacidiphila reveromycinica TaxID=659352 RepID=A0A7U3UN89_9ACTN|nr:acetylxylan esterase [Streptomyces sp. SN-593]BBA95641.1 putative acetyl xylan esterase [Streptomyces sp. SN-593]